MKSKIYLIFFHQTGSGSKKKSQYILRCIEQKRSLVNQVAEIVSTLEKYNQTKKGLSKYIYFIYLKVKKWQVQSVFKTKSKIHIVFPKSKWGRDNRSLTWDGIYQTAMIQWAKQFPRDKIKSHPTTLFLFHSESDRHHNRED